MTSYSFVGCSEPFSSLSHFLGALVCIPCSLKLLRSEIQDSWHKAAVTVFCFACTFLLLMSGIYHLLPNGYPKMVLQRLDHAAIFILIAGTFTPIHTIMFRGFWRWFPLVLIWTIAIFGIIVKTIFFTDIPESVGISVYLGMGWLGAATGGLAWSQRGFSFIQPLVGGSVLYSAGTVFEFLNEPVLIQGVIGPHELFHLMVLAGIAYHWRFVSSLLSLLEDKPLSSTTASNEKRQEISPDCERNS